MKLAEVETFVVGNPPPGYGGRYFIFVKLTTDTGVVGYGEIYSVPFHPTTVEHMVADVFERRVKGTDPFRIELLFRTLYSRGFTQRPDVSMSGILSGIEIACWDIVGKELDRPVHDLLGGRVRDRVRSYTYLYPGDGDTGDEVYANPQLAAERAVAYVEQGFNAIKFDPAGPYASMGPRQPSLEALDRSEAFVREIRAAVGDRADLLFGTHGQFTPSGALRLAKRLESYDPLWFEEPVPPDLPEDLARVAAGTSIPIATGERLTTKTEFARLLRKGSASILQPALGRVGGILEARKIAGMAEAFGAQIAPHLYCGPIEGAANVALAATIPNFLVLEGIQTWGGFHAEILTTPVRWADGFVEVPTAPGLGVELNEDVARAHPYEGDDLHLEMTDGEVF
jgi:L-alanine-DL-glutamate epimerase-like enolase superfamily enzyme